MRRSESEIEAARERAVVAQVLSIVQPLSAQSSVPAPLRGGGAVENERYTAGQFFCLPLKDDQTRDGRSQEAAVSAAKESGAHSKSGLTWMHTITQRTGRQLCQLGLANSSKRRRASAIRYTSVASNFVS
ncbi:hypothetical protein MTO96_016704 [Rhipicephalus appendiculatus]